MSEKAPERIEAGAAPAAPDGVAGTSQSLSSSAEWNASISSHEYPPPPPPPPGADPQQEPVVPPAEGQQAQEETAGEMNHPPARTSTSSSQPPTTETADGGAQGPGRAEKDEPASGDPGSGAGSGDNSSSRTWKPPPAVSAGATSTVNANANATPAPVPTARESQPSPLSHDPNASPCSLMRLTTNEADKVLYNDVRAILGDLGGEDDSARTGVGAASSNGGGGSPGATAPPVSLDLVRPSAALLTVILLLLGAEEVEAAKSKGGGGVKEPTASGASPPVGSLTNFFSRHLSDLAAYCRTLNDAIIIVDVVAYCLNFCKMGSGSDGVDGVDGVATSANNNNNNNNMEHIRRLRTALLQHETCRDIVVGGSFSNSLQEMLVTVLEDMVVQIRSDAEDSGDFAYLWDKCVRVHRRDFAKAFLGTSGYESRHEALAEASRCAYVMDRYYCRSASKDGVANEESPGVPGPAIEQRIKGTVTMAACIVLVYQCGNMEKEVREVDEKEHQEYEKSVGGTEEAIKPRKRNGRADLPIPSPAKANSAAATNANNDIIMENADDSQKAKSYYLVSRRVPSTSASVETEVLDALGAMVENVDDDAFKEGESAPNIVNTLVVATNELIAFLNSPNTGLTGVPNSPSGTSSETVMQKYEVTASDIEEEMLNIYLAFNADRMHFGALHSSLLDENDEVERGAIEDARTLLPRALAPFLCSHWARLDSGNVFASLYFYKLIHANALAEAKWNPQTPISGKIRAFFASPRLIEYTNNHGSFVQSSYIRYEALRAIAPTIRAGLVASDKSVLAQTPVAKVAILDLSILDPFQDGTDLFKESIIKPMEENEWINSLLLDISRAKAIKPSTRLRLYLCSGGRSEQGGEDQWKDVMFLILNKVLDQVAGHYFDLSPSPSSESTSQGAENIRIGSNGELNLANIKTDMKVPEPITDDAFGAALLALYYFSLESILFDESARLKTSKHPRLILNPSFHRALLSVCCICLLRAIGAQSGNQMLDQDISIAANGNTDILSVLKLTKCSPYEFLKVSETFLRSSEQAIFGGLPANIRRHIAEIDDYLVQQAVWASSPGGTSTSKGKTLLNEVDNLLGSQISGTGHTAKYWPVPSLMPTIEGEQDNMAAIGDLKSEAETPPASSSLSIEYSYIDYLFRRASVLASKRISSLCNELSFPASVATEIWLAFRYILRSSTFLLQDRHMDHIIVASTYAACKRLNLDPTRDLFSRIVTAYVAINQGVMSERACHHLLQRVKVNTAKGYGNVIDFYNSVYVHPMKSYLLNSPTLRATALELKSSFIGNEPRALTKGLDNENHRHAYQIVGTNVHVGKRQRNAEPITGEPKKARASFGDPGRKDMNVVQKIVMNDK